MIINPEELRKLDGNENWYREYGEGYRIVYFYENNYKLGTYAKNIKDFMMDFTKFNPIENESDIPKFISKDDLLGRYLIDMPDVIKVGIYKTDGTIIIERDRDSIK